MTRRHVRLLTFLAALALPSTSLLAAEPAQDFEQGRNAYLYGDYPAVVAKIEPLVEPQIRLTDPDDLARAYELLGLSYFYLGRADDARRVFEKLVRFRPDQRLNPVLVPPPAVAFYDEIRGRLADEIARERAALKLREREEAERQRKANQVFIEVSTRRNSRLVAALPFGIGQFQADQPALGGVLLGSELAAVGLSAGFFFAVENLRLDNGRFAREDETRVRDLRTAQLVSGGVAVVLMIAGATHALVTFEEQVELDRRTRPTPAAPPRGPLTFSF